MRTVFAYVRVSTLKQGQHGVSLQEQREAIQRYATRQDLTIARWFEERQTAAKRGRPVFNEMLRLLSRHEVCGVVIHKIDRSTRNLRDWADLGDLLDRGVEIHFAVESLDLHSRGGRLSADIQAVVATDFIRNLREETRKGFYGRLKQGLYPLAAPIGYLDQGGGKAKTVDPTRGHLVQKAFELYATGAFTLETLLPEITRLGLRNRSERPLSLNGLSRLLNNPFYIGLIRLRSTAETFRGTHPHLISKDLFDRVRAQLKGKARSKGKVHDFQFSRAFRCKACRKSLIGELRKGHVYYRCHSSPCETRSIREEPIEAAILEALRALAFSPVQIQYLSKRLALLQANSQEDKASTAAALTFRLGKIQERLSRLTDAFLDATIDRDLFEERKNALLLERISLEDQQRVLDQENAPLSDTLAGYLGLATTAYISYEKGSISEKRELLKELTSDRYVLGKYVAVELREPYSLLANEAHSIQCDPYRGTARTMSELFDRLLDWVKSNHDNKCSIPSDSPL